jgi:hypothetical protein
MKEAIKVAGRRFTTARMVKEYAAEFYAKAMQPTTDDPDPPEYAYPAGSGASPVRT